jgi:two-component system, NtrC family, sensor kinase
MTSDPRPPMDTDPWQCWQGRVLDAAGMGALLAAAAGAAFGAMTAPQLVGESRFPIWGAVGGAACLLATLGLRNLSLVPRSWLCMTGIFLLGVSGLAVSGLAGSGRIWLLTAPLVGALLLGLRPAMFAVLCATAAMAWILFTAGSAGFLEDVTAGRARHWLIECVVFAGAATTLTLCLWLVRGAMVRALEHQARDHEALEQARQDMQALVGAISAVLVLLDAEYRIKRWNRSAEETFSLPAEAVLGKILFELPLDWDVEAVQQAVLTCREGDSHVRLDEIRYSRGGGGDGLLGLTCNPVPGGGVLLLARDITETVSRQMRQAHEQKMQSMGNLAAGVAHEINTPIQYLGYNAGFLEEAFGDLLVLARSCHALRLALEREGAPPRSLLEDLARCERDCDLEYLLDEVPKALAQSRRGMEQISGIVQAMKQLAHPGRLVSKARGLVDCNSIVTNAVTVTRSEWKRHSEVVMDLEHNLPRIPGWSPELGQVVVNLLLNAAHANEEALPKGSRRKGKIVCRTHGTDGWVEIAVADNGPGIPEDIQDKIFDLFFTTKEAGKGTGQGLAIAHAIVVEQHKGEIGFTSGSDGGSVFTLRLPRE